ncbi:MAG: redoxin domain-containing protein [Bryobacterales bacterium]|nr:redoxin domain-containing protein [Bryobacterales bacterium]
MFLPALLMAAALAPVLPLRAPDGKPAQFETAGRVTAVFFISTICPIGNDYNDRFSALYREYQARGVQLLFVNSNINEPAGMVAKHAKDVQFPFPVHKDEGAVVADVLAAESTPLVVILGRDGQVAYRGAVDDARNAARVTRHYTREALEAVLAGRAAPVAKTKSFGCVIKRPRKST